MTKDLKVEEFVDNLAAAHKLDSDLHTQEMRIKERIYKLLRELLPDPSQIQQRFVSRPTILSSVGEVTIDLPGESDHRWKVWCDNGNLECWFKFPGKTPVEEVVNATVNRIAIEGFSKG